MSAARTRYDLLATVVTYMGNLDAMSKDWLGTSPSSQRACKLVPSTVSMEAFVHCRQRALPDGLENPLWQSRIITLSIIARPIAVLPHRCADPVSTAPVEIEFREIPGMHVLGGREGFHHTQPAKILLVCNESLVLPAWSSCPL